MLTATFYVVEKTEQWGENGQQLKLVLRGYEEPYLGRLGIAVTPDIFMKATIGQPLTLTLSTHPMEDTPVLPGVPVWDLITGDEDLVEP